MSEYHIAYWLVVTTNPHKLEQPSFKLKSLYFLLKLLPDNYRHCYALGYIPEINAWLYINPNSHRLAISLIPANDDLLHHIDQNHDDKKCDYRFVDASLFAPYQKTPCWNIRLFMSCATVLAHHIGIPTIWGAPYTPKGLLKTIDHYQSQHNKKEK